MPRPKSKMVIVVVARYFFFFRFPLSVHISVRIMCWKCAVVSRSGLFFSLHFFHFSFLLLAFALTGESKYDENWKELTKMLNNTLGPKKSVDEWKMVSLIANHFALAVTNCCYLPPRGAVRNIRQLRYMLIRQLRYLLI